MKSTVAKGWQSTATIWSPKEKSPSIQAYQTITQNRPKKAISIDGSLTSTAPADDLGGFVPPDKGKRPKKQAGEWFNNAVDNAMFYPIFEMSCGEMEYLTQILKKYLLPDKMWIITLLARKQTNDEINAKTKYSCLRTSAPGLMMLLKPTCSVYQYLQALCVFYPVEQPRKNLELSQFRT